MITIWYLLIWHILLLFCYGLNSVIINKTCSVSDTCINTAHWRTHCTQTPASRSEGQTGERKDGRLPDSERCLLRCQSPPVHQTHSRGPHNNPNQTHSSGGDRRAEGLNITGQGHELYTDTTETHTFGWKATSLRIISTAKTPVNTMFKMSIP